jgi:POT family proton-dependent oligopeptide transporter
MSATAIGTTDTRSETATLFGHPRGLTFLVLTGIWETAALFGMRVVLVYYLVKQLQLPTTEAMNVYSLFSASALLGLFGGYAADRFLGLRRAVIVGLLLMAAGLFALMSPALLMMALVTIALGQGLVRPTLVAQVGLLYAADDPRRDKAFTHYYVGSNVGATIAPLMFGTVGELYGWSWSFLVSGLGMLVAVVCYLWGWRAVKDGHVERADDATVATTAGTGIATSLVVLGLVWLTGVLFWAAYGQLGTSIALWADASVDRSVQLGSHSFEFPATWFQAVNPLLIFAFAPLMAWLSSRTHERLSIGAELRKLASGAVLLAIAFAILAGASAGGGSTNWAWLVLAIAPLTLAELYFVPVGMGLFSRLAVKGYIALFVSLWSLAMMMGNAASGWLAHLWGPLSPPLFFVLAGAVALMGLLILPVARWFGR